MTYSFPKYHGHHLRLIFGLGFLTSAISVLSVLLFFFGPPYLPLWSSLVVPAEQLAPSVWILSLPTLAVGITLSSLWFGRRSEMEHEQYLSGQALWSGILLLLAIVFALLRIMKVVL